jgi:hypothetical protein
MARVPRRVGQSRGAAVRAERPYLQFAMTRAESERIRHESSWDFVANFRKLVGGRPSAYSTVRVAWTAAGSMLRVTLQNAPINPYLFGRPIGDDSEATARFKNTYSGRPMPRGSPTCPLGFGTTTAKFTRGSRTRRAPTAFYRLHTHTQASPQNSSMFTEMLPGEARPWRQ